MLRRGGPGADFQEALSTLRWSASALNGLDKPQRGVDRLPSLDLQERDCVVNSHEHVPISVRLVR